MMYEIDIMNLRHEQPSKPYDRKVDRSSPLGNPFRLMSEYDRETICNQYRQWLEDQLKDNVDVQNAMDELYETLYIYGKLRLFCWCAPKRCHAETIRSALHLIEDEKRLRKGKI